MKWEGVYHHFWSNNIAVLSLQRDIPDSTAYYSQYFMMSMEQATPMNGIEEIAAIKGTIEIYYK